MTDSSVFTSSGFTSAVVLSNSIAFNGFRSWTVGSLEHVTAPAVEQVARDFDEASPALTQAAQPR